MSQSDDSKGKDKTDWSFVDANRVVRRSGKTGPESHAVELVGSIVPDKSKRETQGPLPTLGAPRGVLMEFKSNRMGRKATLEALQEQYNSALTIYKHHLQNVVMGQTARDDVDYAAYQKQLDQEYLEVLAELGLRNKSVREQALIQLTDMTASRLKEVQEKDWPQPLKDAVIDDLIALRQRFSDEMMKELGRP